MITKSQQDELAQLKNYVQARRRQGRHSQYPLEIRQRVSRLRASGVKIAELKKIGLTSSMLYKWKTMAPNQIPAPAIMRVTAGAASASDHSAPLAGGELTMPQCDGAMQLQVGNFSITIKMVGG